MVSGASTSGLPSTGGSSKFGAGGFLNGIAAGIAGGIGAGGGGATATTTGFSGGAGGQGYIVVWEYA